MQDTDMREIGDLIKSSTILQFLIRRGSIETVVASIPVGDGEPLGLNLKPMDDGNGATVTKIISGQKVRILMS